MAPTSYDIAEGLISRLGGNPNNRPLVRAVAIWMRFETGTNITGNNPWNIRGTGPCGGHYFGKNGPFKTYCSLDQGLDDTARLLSISQHGYPKIKAAVRAGDPRAFLVAVYTSKWCHSATQTFCYNNGKSLLSALTGSFSYLYTPSFSKGNPGTVTNPGGGGGGDKSPQYTVAGIIAAIKRITGKDADDVLTTEDLHKIADTYDAPGVIYEQYLKDWEGKTVRALAEDMLKGGARIPFVSDAVDNLGRIADSLGQVVTFIADPENWYYGLMFGAGAIITAWSVRNLFGAELGVRPHLAEAVTEVKQVKPGVTQSKTKTRTR